jgi:hypothetical protein
MTVASYDAFGRARVSEAVTLFDSQLQYNAQPLLWESAGTGTATHNATKGAVQMAVTDGQTLTRQTRAYLRYQPGKSHLILATGVIGAATTDITRRIGYFDDDNGVFFEMNASGMGVVVRSKGSGSVVDTRIEQANWNLSPASYADWSKAQIFLIDIEWLGVGSVRFGLVISGQIRYVHSQPHANIVTQPYMVTANLPVRYQLVSGGAGGAADDMWQICSTVISEAGFQEELGIPHAVGNGATSIAVTTRRAVLSIRPKATFNSITNRGTIIPLDAQIYVSTAPAYFEVVYGGTLGGTPSWTTAGTNSIVEYDVAGTTVTGGEVLAAGYVATTGTGGNARGSSTTPLLSKLPLVLDAAGANPIALSVVVTGIGGTANTTAALNWRELY